HPPRPLVHGNAGGIKDIVRDACRQQQPVQPEPVIAGLVATRHRRNASQRPRRPIPDPVDQRHRSSMIATRQLVAGQLVLVRAAPIRCTQIDAATLAYSSASRIAFPLASCAARAPTKQSPAPVVSTAFTARPAIIDASPSTNASTPRLPKVTQMIPFAPVCRRLAASTKRSGASLS